MVVQWTAKLIAGLIANRRPGEVAAGIAFGLVLALIPTGNLLWLSVFIITLFLRLNFGAEIAAFGAFRLLVPLFDPLLDQVGFAVLTTESLTPFFTALYNVPLLAFFALNNSIVTGGLVTGLVLWLSMFFVGRLGVVQFRTHVQPRIAQSHLVKAFTRIPLVSKFAQALRHFRGVYTAFG
ncbi:MAG: TIGR03546 family protein [Spirochaetia bacterium]